MSEEFRQIQDDLENISGHLFEQLIAEIWEARGWTTTVTSRSNDFGIDVIAEKQDPYPQKDVIQAKCYSSENPVRGPEIREIAGLHRQEPDVDSVIVVTSGRFTKNAKEVAERSNVKLINGAGLSEIISQLSLVDLVWKYRDISTTSEEFGPQKRRRLYNLFQARTQQSDIRNEGPRLIRIYLTLGKETNECYEHEAYNHTAKGLDEEMAERMRRFIHKEEMSKHVDYTELGETTISAMKTSSPKKGTERYIKYHFSIAEAIISNIYNRGFGEISWAIITDHSNTLSTWTDY